MGYMHGGAPHWPISLVAYIFNLFELYFHVALCSVFQSAVVLGHLCSSEEEPFQVPGYSKYFNATETH
jgi:hypothetical protein